MIHATQILSVAVARRGPRAPAVQLAYTTPGAPNAFFPLVGTAAALVRGEAPLAVILDRLEEVPEEMGGGSPPPRDKF
jgi:hypothetical protein